MRADLAAVPDHHLFIDDRVGTDLHVRPEAGAPVNHSSRMNHTQSAERNARPRRNPSTISGIAELHRAAARRNVSKMNRLQQLCAVLCFLGATLVTAPAAESEKLVYIIPIRDDISTPITYLVRRGIKQAMEAGAQVLILDMETNGGRLDSTEEITKAIDQFEGTTVTYVNRKAFSAGAFIAVATQKIYMAPQSVIGAAAPIMMGPTGGVEEMPDTVKAKMNSGVRALVRTSAEKNGHNMEVIDAMIDDTEVLEIEGDRYNEKGQILTLTNIQA